MLFGATEKAIYFFALATDIRKIVYKQSFFINDLYKEAKEPLDHIHHSSLRTTLTSEKRSYGLLLVSRPCEISSK